MKDIIIKGKRLKKEIIIWLICLVIAEGVNLYSIIKYKTNWSELFTQLHYAAALSLLFYLVTIFARWGFSVVKKLKK